MNIHASLGVLVLAVKEKLQSQAGLRVVTRSNLVVFTILNPYILIWNCSHNVLQCSILLSRVVIGCFSITDPIFVHKFLILASKSVTNFGHWSHKNGAAWSLIPQKTADPNPISYDFWSRGCDPRFHPSDPWSHTPLYDTALSKCFVIVGSIVWVVGSQHQVPLPARGLLVKSSVKQAPRNWLTAAKLPAVGTFWQGWRPCAKCNFSFQKNNEKKKQKEKTKGWTIQTAFSWSLLCSECCIATWHCIITTCNEFHSSYAKIIISQYSFNIHKHLS